MTRDLMHGAEIKQLVRDAYRDESRASGSGGDA